MTQAPPEAPGAGRGPSREGGLAGRGRTPGQPAPRSPLRTADAPAGRPPPPRAQGGPVGDKRRGTRSLRCAGLTASWLPPEGLLAGWRPPSQNLKPVRSGGSRRGAAVTHTGVACRYSGVSPAPSKTSSRLQLSGDALARASGGLPGLPHGEGLTRPRARHHTRDTLSGRSVGPFPAPPGTPLPEPSCCLSAPPCWPDQAECTGLRLRPRRLPRVSNPRGSPPASVHAGCRAVQASGFRSALSRLQRTFRPLLRFTLSASPCRGSGTWTHRDACWTSLSAGTAVR